VLAQLHLALESLSPDVLFVPNEIEDHRGAVCVKRQRIATGIYLHFPRQRGNAEVGQFCLTGCGKQNLARFEIAVHHLKVCMEELSAPSMSTATVASASCGICDTMLDFA